MSANLQASSTVGLGTLSVGLIGPSDQRRRGIAHALAGCDITAVQEFTAYPTGPSEVSRLQEYHFDVLIIELDSDREAALNLVEQLGASPESTVMVCSSQSDPTVLMHCMRAGAREFLPQPIAIGTLAEALGRAAARKPAPRTGKEGAGKVLVFLGGKGGSGVTTVACNFAVSIVHDCKQSALLIDLDLPLGDAALTLGISPQFSAVDALQNYSRLDTNFLSKLLTSHNSGLSVLPAPGKFPQVDIDREALERLVAISRASFDYVVIDAGSRFDLSDNTLVEQADTVYLVMQAGIPELRNSHRVISEYFKSGGSNLELVLNRFIPRAGGVDEEHIAKALDRPVQWKIPSDYVAVRRMQNEATPLTLEDSMIANAIRDMARAACGVESEPAKKKRKGFSLFG
ncbi:MAG: AAA family ATPase [Terracidiphilus sp.]